MKTTLITLFLGAVIVISQPVRSVGAEAKAPTPEKPADAAARPDSEKAITDKDAPTPLTSTNTSMIIRRGARLLYKIEEDPTKTGDMTVAPVDILGEAWFNVSRGSDKSLPPIKVADRTLDDVAKELKAALDKVYYVDCKVWLSLESNGPTPTDKVAAPDGKSGLVLFIGPCMRGRVTIPPGTKKMISEAILELPADQFANLKKVEIESIDPKTKAITTQKVDVDAILYKKQREKDVELHDGDHVKIYEKIISVF